MYLFFLAARRRYEADQPEHGRAVLTCPRAGVRPG